MPDPELPDNVLSGAFHLLGVVNEEELTEQVLDDIKTGTQDVDYIGNTHDGFEGDVDWNEFDVSPSSGMVTQTYRTHVSYEFETNTFATPSVEQLEDAGLVDTSSGQIFPSSTFVAAISEVYDGDPREEGAEPIETFVWPSVEITIDGLSYPGDAEGEYPLMMNVNDHPYLMSYRDEPA